MPRGECALFEVRFREQEGGLQQDGNAESGRPEGCRNEAGSPGIEGRDRFTGICRKRRGYLHLPAGGAQRGERRRSLREGPVDERARDDLRRGRSHRGSRAAEVVISGQWSEIWETASATLIRLPDPEGCGILGILFRRCSNAHN